MRSRRAGFSLLEAVIALSLFAVVGYGLVVTLDVGQDTDRLVRSGATRNRELREAARRVSEEMRCSRNSAITVTTLADGNHELSLMVPIQNEGVNGWGVYDTALGTTEAERNRENWLVRYTVLPAVIDGQTVHQLVRRVLDDQGDVQLETVIADGLRSGGGTPGFQVLQAGVMWEIRIAREAEHASGSGDVEVFHVQARNAD